MVMTLQAQQLAGAPRTHTGALPSPRRRRDPGQDRVLPQVGGPFVGDRLGGGQSAAWGRPPPVCRRSSARYGTRTLPFHVCS